jgi:hypothetical protein
LLSWKGAEAAIGLVVAPAECGIACVPLKYQLGLAHLCR